jgi:hypothetical protein
MARTNTWIFFSIRESTHGFFFHQTTLFIICLLELFIRV